MSMRSGSGSPRCEDGFAFLDAPGGSQVPDEVGDAIARALREASANLGAVYATSLRVKEILERAESQCRPASSAASPTRSCSGRT